MNSEPVTFLSPEWARALEEAANASNSFREATRTVALTIEQEITEDSGDPVRYALAIGDGVLRVLWGGADDPHVVFTQSRETAERISRGELNAQQAFVLGKLRVRGDLERLLTAREAFVELEGAFAGLRARTVY